jgi:GLPGLI family protein
MKKSVLFCLVMAILATAITSTQAQKTISEGKVVYQITYPDMEMDRDMAAMMPTESVIRFKGPMSRVDMSMGMGISSATIMNNKSGEVVSMTDMMGNKTAIRVSAEENRKLSKESEPSVEFTADKKDIAGYPCKKALLKNDKGGEPMEIYYTDKIAARYSNTNEWSKINGFPLEYTMRQNGITMKMTATEVSPEKINDELFKIPDDYKMMTMEEMMKMMGGEK